MRKRSDAVAAQGVGERSGAAQGYRIQGGGWRPVGKRNEIC